MPHLLRPMRNVSKLVQERLPRVTCLISVCLCLSLSVCLCLSLFVCLSLSLSPSPPSLSRTIHSFSLLFKILFCSSYCERTYHNFCAFHTSQYRAGTRPRELGRLLLVLQSRRVEAGRRKWLIAGLVPYGGLLASKDKVTNYLYVVTNFVF